MPDTSGADLLYVCVAVRLFADGLFPVRLYHGVEHAHRLPYHLTLRTGTRLQRDAQRGVEHDIAVLGTADAGRLGCVVWRGRRRDVLVAVYPEICTLLGRQHLAHSHSGPLLSASLL